MIKENKKKLLLILVGLFLLVGWFYWFEWRPMKIRQQCFKEVYSEYPTKLEWAKNKEWMYYSNGKWGWLYPYWKLESEADIYKGCLIFRGLK